MADNSKSVWSKIVILTGFITAITGLVSLCSNHEDKSVRESTPYVQPTTPSNYSSRIRPSGSKQEKNDELQLVLLIVLF